jgi:hypothetical protein
VHEAREGSDPERICADKIYDKSARHLLVRGALLLNRFVVDESVESGATSNPEERLDPKQMMDQEDSEHRVNEQNEGAKEGVAIVGCVAKKRGGVR